jgi:His/Glu/Gln/Arg/opine family amino acid ABC transporter permease subunit
VSASAEITSTSGVDRPDVRGPTAPLPLAILVAGIVGLCIVVAGTLLLQVAHAVRGGGLTPACRAAGLEPQVGEPPNGQNIGTGGVCDIVEALRSGAETTVLVLGGGLGLAAMVAGYARYRSMDTRRKRDQAVNGAILGMQAAIVAALILWFRSGSLLFPFARNIMNFTLLQGSFHIFLRGAGVTLYLAFLSEAGGITLGLVLSILAISSRKTVRAPARIYINFFRGTPLIWQLSFFSAVFTFGLALHLSTYTTAIIILSLNMGAYSAEVFRAGLQSIERGQIEAARSLGMSYLQAMRHAIVPQALRRVIPPLMNEFVILIKDTSLVFVLGIVLGREDLFGVGQEGYSNTFNATWFVATALGYLAVTLPLIGIVNAVERRLRSGLVGIAGAGA